MTCTRSLSIALVVTLSLTPMASSQTTPAQVVHAAFQAFSGSDWQTFASLVHPDALAAFRTAQLGSAVGWTLVRRDPKTRHRNIAITPSDYVTPDAIDMVKDLRLAEFPGEPTIGELAALSPRDFLVRWCEAAFRKREHTPWLSIQATKRAVIGEVMEGDTLGHVLYRQEGESVWLAGSLKVMSLKQVAGQWLILLNDDVIWTFPLVGPAE
jgi:hypothetical protein